MLPFWFVWETECPEEGSCFVRAEDEASAIVEAGFGGCDGTEFAARRVDVGDLETLATRWLAEREEDNAEWREMRADLGCLRRFVGDVAAAVGALDADSPIGLDVGAGGLPDLDALLDVVRAGVAALQAGNPEGDAP